MSSPSVELVFDRHPSESWDPAFAFRISQSHWIPAFAGMTASNNRLRFWDPQGHRSLPYAVIPAKAGIQLLLLDAQRHWIPAFAGMTASNKRLRFSDLKDLDPCLFAVIPAKAGIQPLLFRWSKHWIPAFAGMTASNKHLRFWISKPRSLPFAVIPAKAGIQFCFSEANAIGSVPSRGDGFNQASSAFGYVKDNGSLLS